MVKIKVACFFLGHGVYTATIRTGDTAELYVCEGIEGEWLGEWERGQRRWSGVANA